MTYSPNPDAILKNEKKGEPAPNKSSFVGRVLDSVARAATDVDKKIDKLVQELGGETEKLNDSVKGIDESVKFVDDKVNKLAAFSQENLNDHAKDLLKQGARVSSLEVNLSSLAARMKSLEDGVKDTINQAAQASINNTTNSVEYFEEKLEETSEKVKEELEGKVREIRKDASDLVHHVVTEATKPVKRAFWAPVLVVSQIVFDVGAITYIVLERLGLF